MVHIGHGRGSWTGGKRCLLVLEACEALPSPGGAPSNCPNSVQHQAEWLDLWALSLTPNVGCGGALTLREEAAGG